MGWLRSRRPDAARGTGALADVTIAARSRTFDFTFRRPRRFLFWTVWSTVRRRYTVRALPTVELVALHVRISETAEALGGFTIGRALAFIIGTADAAFFVPEQAEAMWNWHCEANRLNKPNVPAAPQQTRVPVSSPSSSRSSAGPPHSVRN